MHKVVRRFRAAKDKFGPWRRFKGSWFKGRFVRRGPAAKGGKARESLYCGDAFVSHDHVPGEQVEIFFKGGERKGKICSKCFGCGRPGDFANGRPSFQELCFKCGKPGRRTAQCTAAVAVSAFVPSHRTCHCVALPGGWPRAAMKLKWETPRFLRPLERLIMVMVLSQVQQEHTNSLGTSLEIGRLHTADHHHHRRHFFSGSRTGSDTRFRCEMPGQMRLARCG